MTFVRSHLGMLVLLGVVVYFVWPRKKQPPTIVIDEPIVIDLRVPNG
jgi:hypothetical protein